MVGAGGGYDDRVGGESRVSSGDGRAMAALGRKRPDEGLGRGNMKVPMVGDGENEGWPESRSRRSASVHGAIHGAGERVGVDLMGRSRLDGGFEAEKGSMVSLYGVVVEVADGVVDERMVVDGAGGREGRAHPSRCPA